jgi:hypothetical protein
MPPADFEGIFVGGNHLSLNYLRILFATGTAHFDGLIVEEL